MLADILGVQLALGIAVGCHLLVAQWFMPSWHAPITGYHVLLMALGFLSIPLSLHCCGMYPGYGLPECERLRRRSIVTLAITFCLLLWCAIAPRFNHPFLLCFTAGIYALAIGPALEAIVRSLLIKAGKFGRPIVVLGAGVTAQRTITALHRHPELGLIPTKIFDDNPALQNTTVAGVPVCGTISDARRKSNRCRIAIVAMPNLPGDMLADLANRLPYRRVIVIPDLLGLASLWVSTRDMGGLLGLELRNKLLSRRSWFIKRTMDILLGVPMLIVALPVMGALALWIKIVSPGASPFYKQTRVGFGGKPITVVKMRSMVPDADDLLSQHVESCPNANAEWKNSPSCATTHASSPASATCSAAPASTSYPNCSMWSVAR